MHNFSSGLIDELLQAAQAEEQQEHAEAEEQQEHADGEQQLQQGKRKGRGGPAGGRRMERRRMGREEDTLRQRFELSAERNAEHAQNMNRMRYTCMENRSLASTEEYVIELTEEAVHAEALEAQSLRQEELLAERQAGQAVAQYEKVHSECGELVQKLAAFRLQKKRECELGEAEHEARQLASELRLEEQSAKVEEKVEEESVSASSYGVVELQPASSAIGEAVGDCDALLAVFEAFK